MVPASIEKLCVQKGIKKNKNPHHILFLKGKNQLKNSINLEELELGGVLIKRKIDTQIYLDKDFNLVAFFRGIGRVVVYGLWPDDPKHLEAQATRPPKRQRPAGA